MNAPFTIKAGRGADVAALAAIFHAAVQGADAYTPRQRAAWSPPTSTHAWQRHYPARAFWVAWVRDTAAAFTDLEPDGNIDMLYVHPAYGRRGIGAALLAHAEAQARAQNLKRLYAAASITARPVFIRAGFQVLAEQSVVRRKTRFTNYVVEKELT